MTSELFDEVEYHEWLGFIKTHHDEEYYENLLRASANIIEDLKTMKQHVVAENLNLPAPRLSSFKPVLEAYIKMQND